jgi:hypothetical protein
VRGLLRSWGRPSPRLPCPGPAPVDGPGDALEAAQGPRLEALAPHAPACPAPAPRRRPGGRARAPRSWAWRGRRAPAWRPPRCPGPGPVDARPGAQVLARLGPRGAGAGGGAPPPCAPARPRPPARLRLRAPATRNSNTLVDTDRPRPNFKYLAHPKTSETSPAQTSETCPVQKSCGPGRKTDAT